MCTLDNLQDPEGNYDKACDDRDHWCDMHTIACRDRDAYRSALDTLYAIVGLTAFKYEEQRAVLQEAMDQASTVLHPKP